MNDQESIIYKWRILLAFSIAVFFMLFSLLGIWRHWGYLTSIHDLGVFDQSVWNAANGNGLTTTSIFSYPINWLGFHFQPILFVFVWLYKLIPNVNWLIFAQASALSVTALPIFFIVKHITGSERNAFIWSLIYLFNPWVLSAAAWDFHPIALAVPIFAIGLQAVVQNRLGLLIIASVVLVGCREDMGLAVAGFGLLYWIQHRSWATGVAFLVSGLAVFVVTIEVTMPAFADTARHPMFRSDLGQLSRYEWLGSSILEVLQKFLEHPGILVRAVMVEMKGGMYIYQLLGPFLLLSLLSPIWILPVIGVLLVNLLSANPMPRSLFSYHSVAVIPALLIAAVYGSQMVFSRMIRPSMQRLAFPLSLLILLLNIALAYRLAPLPLPGSENVWKLAYINPRRDPVVAQIRDLIGDSPVTIQANIGSHFSQRRLIYRYPQMIDEVEFVVLYLESPTTLLQHPEIGRAGTLKHHLQMDPGDYLDSIVDLIDVRQYCAVLWEDPWVVLRRECTSPVFREGVVNKIEFLRLAWSQSNPSSEVSTGPGSVQVVK